MFFLISRSFGVLVAMLLVSGFAGAQTYPNRPIKLVVPFPPGGSADVLGRLLSQSLGEKLKQPIVIENKPGAGTILGAEAVAKAPADGYTLLLSAAGTYVINTLVYKKLPYDPISSFDPLGIVGATPMVVLVNPSVKANSLKELVVEVKSMPNGGSYGSFGNGSTSNFGGELLNTATHMTLLHVPYKGSAPLMQDLMGRQIEVSIDTLVAAVPQVTAKKVKALAVMGPVRSALLPKVPTTAEAGFPSVALTTWFAIVGPRGMPASVRATLEAAIAATMKEKAVKDAMIRAGYDPEYASADEYRARVPQEIARLRPIAEASKISVD